MRRILIEVGAGELVDRATILELKERNARDAAQRDRVRHQRQHLLRVCERAGLDLSEVASEMGELRVLNGALWAIEDQLRACEREGDFGPRFIRLARAVYQNNDRRAFVKRAIDVGVGSSVGEEKVYASERGRI